MTGRRTDDGCTDGRKNNVALAHPYHEGKRCRSLVEFRLIV